MLVRDAGGCPLGVKNEFVNGNLAEVHHVHQHDEGTVSYRRGHYEGRKEVVLLYALECVSAGGLGVLLVDGQRKAYWLEQSWTWGRALKRQDRQCLNLHQYAMAFRFQGLIRPREWGCCADSFLKMKRFFHRQVCRLGVTGLVSQLMPPLQP